MNVIFIGKEKVRKNAKEKKRKKKYKNKEGRRDKLNVER